jgi:hypothetical protein
LNHALQRAHAHPIALNDHNLTGSERPGVFARARGPPALNNQRATTTSTARGERPWRCT